MSPTLVLATQSEGTVLFFGIERFAWRRARIEDAVEEIAALPPMPLFVTFVHAHKRYNPITHDRRPPGLHVLVRSCEVDSARLAAGIEIADGDPAQRIVLVATVPLSDEPWQPLGEGELIVLRDGDVIG